MDAQLIIFIVIVVIQVNHPVLEIRDLKLDTKVVIRL